MTAMRLFRVEYTEIAASEALVRADNADDARERVNRGEYEAWQHVSYDEREIHTVEEVAP